MIFEWIEFVSEKKEYIQSNGKLLTKMQKKILYKLH
jgi:hypothetical protein